MSGNVSQMVNLLEMCLTSMDNDIPPKGVLHSTINAVNAVHKVYVGMQVQLLKDQSLFDTHRHVSLPRKVHEFFMRNTFSYCTLFCILNLLISP